MSRTDQRRAALRFCLITVAWVCGLFGLVSILSFDPADPPADGVWPPNAPTANLCGTVGAHLAHGLFFYIGIGAYPLAGLFLATLIAWSRSARLSDLWLRFLGLTMICAAVSTAGTMFVDASAGYAITGPGGVLGTAAAHFFQSKLQTTGTIILMTAATVVGLLLAADELVVALARSLGWVGRRAAPAVAGGGTALVNAGAALAAGVAGASERIASAAKDGSRQPKRSRQLDLELDEEAAPDPDDAPSSCDQTPSAVPLSKDGKLPAPAPLVREMGGALLGRKRQSTAGRKTRPSDGFTPPDIEQLDESAPIDTESIEILCREKAYVLEQTLNEFRLEVQVVAIDTGPVITVFELKLAPGIKVSQIVSLSNDMARALKAPAVRVVAPMPGKNTIGIEVPNIDKEKVRLKDLMNMSARRAEAYAIPLFLGKDASGQALVSDLTRMPHLLIAGTTGSGKSVCISSIITSILMTRSPEQVNLVLVDPKVVELAVFKDIPHLMCPIVTDVGKAEAILDWAATKMDERYALFAELGVKDIAGYNRLGPERLRERIQPTSDEEMQRIPERLPYIVIVIDELADLMMTSAKEVEFFLCRLAQKSRAVGIHLIVSTQRPQANVVTGLIKSNLPCRIAFRVSSRLDSRIVLDQNGGEVLMGQGDMLFLPPGSSKLIRAQGTFISDDELRRVVKHSREQAEPSFHPELVRMRSNDAEAGTTERDGLFDQAVEVILETGRGSVSLLQRRLTVGYGRASRLIDQMFEAGIVGEYKGSQAREVNMTKEEWQAARLQRDREEAAETVDVQSGPES